MDGEEPARKRRNREHQNSRNGCGQCKARKVKCGEEKPKCRACTRRNTPCTYPNDGLHQLASAASAASSPHDRGDHNFSFTPIQSEFGVTPLSSGNARPESSTKYTPAQQEYRAITPKHDAVGPQKIGPVRAPPPTTASRFPSLNLNLEHLELFHHFITITATAISAGSLTHDLWRMTVPQIALSHEWLMHGILAMAALHIAHLRPDMQSVYWKRALMHQDQAFQGQQKALTNPTPENADALFAFTLVVIFLSFASEKALQGVGDMGYPLQAATRCLHMLRGIRAIDPAVKSFVERGPLAHLASLHPRNIRSNPTFRELSTEDHFSKLLVFSSTNADVNEDYEMSDTESYASAASSLRASFLKVEAVPEGEPMTPPIWHWAVRLHPSFVTRISERQVVPLILTAHWCVLLAQVQHYWFIQGWIDQTMAEIGACLAGEHHGWLDWPRSQIEEIRRMKAERGG
ncbi:hypothetical protein ACLMJK_008908 [Lecanora helva]